MGLLPEATYRAEIIEQGLAKTAKNAPYVSIKFKLLAMIEGGAERPSTGDHRREIQLWLTDKAMDQTLEKLERLGCALKTFGQLDSRHPEYIPIIGKQISVYCKHDEYQGKKREKWNFSVERKVTSDEIAALDEMMQRAKSKPATSDDEPPEFSDEHIGDPPPDGGDPW